MGAPGDGRESEVGGIEKQISEFPYGEGDVSWSYVVSEACGIGERQFFSF